MSPIRNNNIKCQILYSNLNMDRSTITKILSESDKWKAINANDSAQTFKHKEVKFSVLEHAMSLWVENVIAGGIILMDLLIREKQKCLQMLLIFKK
ncbi:9395_t:CDS:2 [Funneliformis geosporum]|nr:9395_t:CDS:2 [Funneliformis geosporum]